jgi:hypothetical protein
MNKPALIMILGYERSKEDARRQACNPLNDGSWDAEALKARLTKTAGPCEMLDRIVPDDEVKELIGW